MDGNRNKTITDLQIHETSCRREIIQVFLDHSGVAFSEGELRTHLHQKFDRTTIYRTVKMLIRKNFIHRVICDLGVLKYALTDRPGSKSEHAHFQCMKCKTVFCIEGEIQTANPPKGYTMQSTLLLMTGVCKSCSQNIE
ncbi:MAG TPA: transcriptional repressor [Cyclobacteriaceae bacterium]|nr:transcriptional repressor [Cyclobacteriaceae bacterium]